MKKVIGYRLSVIDRLPRWLFVCLLLLFTFHFPLSTLAQAQPTQLPPATRYTVSFESQHGESFTVYIDGDQVNRMPQSRVLVTDLSDQTHEVVVVLKRPAAKAAVLSLRPGEPNVMVNVTYDQRLEQLMLYTPSYNRAESYVEEKRMAREELKKHGERPPVPLIVPMDPTYPDEPENTTATEEDMEAMLQRMKAQPFDSDRLSLAKVMVASSNLTAMQIGRLAKAIDYSNSQVEFLKYAYSYCLDPTNYYDAINVLTFSRDRKKVIDFIATQQ